MNYEITVIVVLLLLALVAAFAKLRQKPKPPSEITPPPQAFEPPPTYSEPVSFKARPQWGDQRWSGHFGSMIEMQGYNGDSDYTFKVLTGPHAGRVYQNKSSWSFLPLRRPDDVRLRGKR